MTKTVKIGIKELRKEFGQDLEEMLNYLLSLRSSNLIGSGNCFRLVKKVFQENIFRSWPARRQINLSRHLEQFEESGQDFFVEKVMPVIWGGSLSLKSLRTDYQNALVRPPKISDISMTDLLDENGRISEPLSVLAREIYRRKEVATVALMPTIGDRRRLRCGTLLAKEILSRTKYDRFVLSGQIVGNNEHRLGDFANALSGLFETESLGQFPPEQAKSAAEIMLKRVLNLNVTEHFVFKDERFLPEMGIGIRGISAKSQNLWTAQLLASQKFQQARDILFYFTDDDYGEMNIALDASFHYIISALMLVEGLEELNVLLKGMSTEIKAVASTVSKLYVQAKGCFFCRSGGARVAADPVFIKQLESGEGSQRSLPEMLAEIILADLCRDKEVVSDQAGLIYLLDGFTHNKIELTPSMLDRNPELLAQIIFINRLAGSFRKARHMAGLLGRVYLTLKKRGSGGRVTEEWKGIVKESWGREIRLNELSYPLHGNCSVFWSRIKELSGLQGIGYTVETVMNVIGALKGGIATYSDGLHSHMPGSSEHIYGPGGMRQTILESLFLLGIQCMGISALGQFEWMDFSGERPEFIPRPGKRVPLSLDRLYLPGFQGVRAEPIKASRQAFISLNEQARSAGVVLAFNPILLGEQAKELRSDGFCTLIGATPSTLSELLALGRIGFPVFVESGCGLYVPDFLANNFFRAAESISVDWEKAKNGIYYWLTEKLGPAGFALSLSNLEKRLHERAAHFRKVRLVPLHDLSLEKLMQYGGLKDKKAVERALARDFPIQPFYIDAPPGISWKDVLRKLSYTAKPDWEVLPSIRFCYLSPSNQAGEGKAIRKFCRFLMPRGKKIFVSLGQTQQKKALHKQCDYAFVCKNGENYVKGIPFATYLPADAPNALAIIMAKIAKSCSEKQ